MGEHGPLARETSSPAPRAAPIIDPIALEERLKVARELRAEAIARRQSVASPRPVPPPPPARPAQRPSAADAVGGNAAHVPAAPALPVPRRAAAVMAQRSRDGLRAPQIAHPLVALLALGLTLSWTLAREAPDAPARPAAARVAAETPRPPVATRSEAAAAPTAEPVIAEAAPAPAAARAAAAPAAEATPPDAPLPAVIEAAAAGPPAAPGPPAPMPRQAAAAEPAATAGPPPAEAVAAPRPQRILVNAPRGAPVDAVEAAVGALRQDGFVDVANQPTRLTISSSSVRFYHPEDAAAAAEAAALIGPLLPGGAEARDFTEAPSRGAPGHLEIWIAGDGSAGSRPAAAGRTRPAPGIDGAEIQRLVETVLTAPAIENVGRGVAGAARGLDAGAERLARDVDSAIGDAFRALEGRR